MAFKKKIEVTDVTETTEKIVETPKETIIIEKRDFPIQVKETKEIKEIKKSEYDTNLHIAL